MSTCLSWYLTLAVLDGLLRSDDVTKNTNGKLHGNQERNEKLGGGVPTSGSLT